MLTTAVNRDGELVLAWTCGGMKFKNQK